VVYQHPHKCLSADNSEDVVLVLSLRKQHQTHILLKFKEKVEDSKICFNNNLQTLTNVRLPKLRENLQDVISLKVTKEQENQDMMSQIITRADKIGIYMV
jgi:hypothetical protein